jgi:hypothetical protein
METRRVRFLLFLYNGFCTFYVEVESVDFLDLCGGSYNCSELFVGVFTFVAPPGGLNFNRCDVLPVRTAVLLPYDVYMGQYGLHIDHSVHDSARSISFYFYIGNFGQLATINIRKRHHELVKVHLCLLQQTPHGVPLMLVDTLKRYELRRHVKHPAFADHNDV